MARSADHCGHLMDDLPCTLKGGRPICPVFDHDLAGLVGNIPRHDFDIKNDILAIDGGTLHECDLIDLGKILESSGTVAVVGVPVLKELLS